jgi:hypothetical protein
MPDFAKAFTCPLRSKHTAICLLLTILAGCSTALLQQDGLTDLRKGVAGVREQARLAMTDANQLARDQAIARVLALNKPALSEKDFVGAVSKDDIAKWDSSLAVLDQYLTAIQYLTSPNRTTELEDAAVSLGNQLATGTTNTAVSPAVGTAFTQLGKAIVEAKANKDALGVMQRTDGSIRMAFNAMAQAIYDPTTNSGLRSTVLSSWNTAINGNDVGTPLSRWVAAIDARADVAVKRQIINDYLQMLDARDAQLAALDRLRLSLNLLADAHSRAAQGQTADVSGIIAWVDRQLTETQALYARFKAISDVHATANATTKPATTQPARPNPL